MRAVRTIALTGHRPRHLPRDAARHIRAAVREVADQYPGATWLTGGAIGADQIATDELLALGRRVELVLAFPVAVQAARWAAHQRRALDGQLQGVAGVDIVSPRYRASGYHERNRRLVQRADLLVACWNGRPGSGTAATVRMAEARRLPVIVVPMD
jgi:uncharacterized phage-like protein YoqJ